MSGCRLVRYVAISDLLATKWGSDDTAEQVFAMTYDRQTAKVDKAGLRDARKGLLAGAAGRVLEIGGETGNNLPFYGPAVESLTITSPRPRCCGPWNVRPAAGAGRYGLARTSGGPAV
jgi:hypothetical protein